MSVLRPACFSDLPTIRRGYDGYLIRWFSLTDLYNAEWRLRGFPRSP